mgnify:CR=1 FL=1
MPDFSITNKYLYHFRVFIETMRGCPFNCAFCTATLYSGSKYRYMPEGVLRGTIEKWCLRRIMPIRLANTNLVADHDKTARVLNILKEYDIRWWSACSTNIVEHEDLIKLSADAGAIHLQFGFESVDEGTLAYINKRQNVVKKYKLLVKKMHDYGISVGGNFIFGFDTDTPEIFKRTEEFVNDTDIDILLYGMLVPFPGTRIFDQYHAEGRILTYNWAKYNAQHLVYEPKNMTREQLINGIAELYDNTYSPSRILKRFSYARSAYDAIMNASMGVVAHIGRHFLYSLMKGTIDESFDEDSAYVMKRPPNKSFESVRRMAHSMKMQT